MTNHKIFKSLYDFIEVNIEPNGLNKTIGMFVDEKGKAYFDNECIYINLEHCEWPSNICKRFGASALTLLIAKIRKSSQTEWKGLPTKYNKNLNALKIKISASISECYKDNLRCNSLKNSDEKRLLILLPILPANKNNNISNVVLSYLAALRENFSNIADYKLIITNELDFSNAPTQTSLVNTSSYHKMVEGYGGNKEDIINLAHDEGFVDKFLYEVNKFSPTHVFVPNFELTCSYLDLLKRKSFCIFMQTNIKNQTPYNYDVYLSCGKVEDVPLATVKGRVWERFNFGYPKFGFLGECNIDNNDNLKLVFVSNRLNTELQPEFLSRINTLMKKFDNVEFHLLGVRNEGQIRGFLAGSFDEDNLLRIKLVGYIDNVGDYLKACDVYVNPTRLGGGVSMALSLYADTPILLNGVSDATNFLDNEGVYNNYDEQFSDLDLFISNPEKLVSLLEKQKKHFLKHNSPYGASCQIVSYLSKAQSNEN
tara:strand:+ start:20618 stop:22063 length:1446 start_codon:yes stop_codon:yes gene_type:complete